VQVLVAIVLGVLVGHFFPKTGTALKPLGDAFISLIKMMIAPVIFCTVVHGIASMRDLRKVGRVGLEGARLFRTGLYPRAGDRPGGRRAGPSGHRLNIGGC
jgi:aerobic C4-dicarboxylate transport protein